MQKLRFFLALWCAKAANLALKICHRSASTFPVAVALKI